MYLGNGQIEIEDERIRMKLLIKVAENYFFIFKINNDFKMFLLFKNTFPRDSSLFHLPPPKF